MSNTVQYKRTLRGSVGAGVGALFNGNGRRFFILEHRDASKYHQAGESQKIIIDQIELGRDIHCQVRFDESFTTVSRRHAAIVKDGDRWKLVQLSKTNSTLLNGRPVENEWYLESGDEIQLSIGGPRLGFIVPVGKQSLVSSIKLTERLDLFRKQALRPYKTALVAMGVILVVCVGGLSTWNVMMKNEYDGKFADAGKRIEKLNANNEVLNKKILNTVSKEELDKVKSIASKGRKTVVIRPIPTTQNGDLKRYEDDIFFIQAALAYVENGEVKFFKDKDGDFLAWSGTGFLLSDGRFVTAKHCVESWKFDSKEELAKQMGILQDDEMKACFVAGLTGSSGIKIFSYIVATSPTKQYKFKSTDFKCPRYEERSVSIGNGLSIIQSKGEGGTDWAYTQVGAKGSIIAGTSISSSLPAGVDLKVLGYPRGMSTNGGSCLYGSCQTSARGLHKGEIVISGKNYEHGNSGGPVFYNENGKFKAVGIVSYGMYESMGGLTPLCNLR